MKSSSFKMLVVLSPIFVVDTKITFVYNFVAPLSVVFKLFTAWKVSIFAVILARIQSECGKIRTRITPNTDTFHAVIINIRQSKLFGIAEKSLVKYKWVTAKRKAPTQSVFTCSKLTIETLAQVVKYVQSLQVVLVTLLLTMMNIFHALF